MAYSSVASRSVVSVIITASILDICYRFWVLCLQSVVVLQQLDFVCDYTKEYGSSKVLKGLDTELGSEFRYGCLCFSLLHEYPLNSGICIEKGEPQILLQALEVQQDQNLIQCSVLAARDMCAHFDCAMIFSNLPNAKDVTLDLLTKFPPGGNAATPQEADELITPRLELLERTAISRNTYNGETCISTLVSIWDDCDKGVYTVETLRYVFRAMRRVLNESWTDPILSVRQCVCVWYDRLMCLLFTSAALCCFLLFLKLFSVARNPAAPPCSCK